MQYIKKFLDKRRGIDPDAIRTLYVNSPELNYTAKFPNNYVRTSKYTIFTFIPKNLLEQFMRVANLYFLVISGFQQIPGVSPTGQWTTLGPLLVVLAFTALKEAFEDMKRHRQDNEINHRKVDVLRGEEFVPVLWQDVQVGDILKVVNRSFIPADLILLSSSEPQSLCYIETANLDGETNLKSRQALTETAHMSTKETLKELTGCVVKSEQPNNKLYNFDGSIEFGGQVYPLGPKEIVLRGAMLRNTKWIYGIAVFTGHDTKLMQNANAAPVKRTNVERQTNFQILFMFILLLLMASISTIGYSVWSKSNSGHNAWYLHFSSNQAASTALAFITFVILYNNLIPISLYVSVEIVKFGQAFFINNDLEMYHEESDTPALARTSNLNEELGQVEYIFSDKTGTLTCNRMEFLKCSLGGISYGSGETEIDRVNKARKEGREIALEVQPTKKKTEFSFVDESFYKNLRGGHETTPTMREAMLLLSVCHTVIPEEDKDDPSTILYQASSPDEAALVSAAKHFGFYFYKRTPKSVTVKIDGTDQEYQILNTLEFTNVRKRMSVIAQGPDGKIVLYCKGADNVILERLGEKQLYKEQTLKHLDDFAGQGLRTLCLAKVDLDNDRYQEWSKLYFAAATTIVNRDQELEKVAELIEKDLFLLGATAVEDKLQDGVPETIATLAKAGIKIWVLTGDKQETAINIGFACRLLTKEMEMLIINESTKEDTRRKIESFLKKYENVEASETLALVIDGLTLHYALEEELKFELLKLATKCKAVICCRVSPLQKAQVVQLVRQNLSAITLAIGDGANDVSMIQAAHVGIGISGEEGLQAARASDYAIAQFRFLKRLLLVHGRLSYRRISKTILYCFYKNVLLYFTQFWYTFANGYSGQTLYERWTLAAYNVAFTLVPVILLGLQDKDVSEDTVYANPQLYKSGHAKYHFNIRVFWGWILNAVFHSFVIFVIPTLAFEHGILRTNGLVTDLWGNGTVIYTCVVAVVSIKLGLESKHWTWPFAVGLGGSVFVWVLWLLIYAVIAAGKGDFGADAYMVTYNVYAAAAPYFVIFLVIVIALFRDFAWKFINRTLWPRPYHIFQEIEYLSKTGSLSNDAEIQMEQIDAKAVEEEQVRISLD